MGETRHRDGSVTITIDDTGAPTAEAIWRLTPTSRRYSLAGIRFIEVGGQLRRLDGLTAKQVASITSPEAARGAI